MTRDPVEIERHNRIMVAAYAYAYEIEDDPIADDATYDKLALSIDLSVETGREDLDAWFKEHFAPHTGQWVRSHPELDKLASVVRLIRTGSREEPKPKKKRKAKPKQAAPDSVDQVPEASESPVDSEGGS
jgi:hypothetical protein